MFHILIVTLVTKLYTYQNLLNFALKIIEFYCVYNLYFNNADKLKKTLI